MHLINSNCTVKRRATLSVAETEVLNFSLRPKYETKV